VPTETQRSLLEELVARTPQQPATAFWRAIELAVVLENPFPEGIGLDVGCGDGSVIEVLRDHGLAARLVGLDADPLEVDLARSSGVYERAECASAAEIPEPDASFDFAFSNSVLEHIPPVGAALREVARVLKPGAPFTITVPVQAFDDSLAGPGVLAPLLGRTRPVYLQRMDQRLAHVNLWSPQRWRSELEAAGFRVTREIPYLSVDEARRWEKIANWTGGLVFGLMRRRGRLVDATRTLRISTGSRGARLLAPITARVARRAINTVGLTPSPTYGCRLFVAERAS
jgi:SAM-dependent methyltransferase